VTHLSGLVCVRHKRFTCGELDIDVSALPAHLDAETRMRETLTCRGITPGSGELELALALLSAAVSDGHAAVLHQRMLNTPRKLPITIDTLKYLLYPEIVELADIITEPSFCARLLSPRWGPNTQATLLVATVTGVLGTDPSPTLDTVARDTLAHDNDAVSASYGMTSVAGSLRNVSVTSK